MATFNIYKLHFTTPLHIDEGRKDESSSLKTIHSDTFYAALTACLAKLGEDIPDNGDLGVTISSLFPYFQKSEDCEPVYFFPKPFQTRQIELKDRDFVKKVKKVQWVDSEIFSNLLNGKHLSDDNDFTHIQNAYLTSKELPRQLDGTKDFIQTEISQRVSIVNRTGKEDAKPFTVDKIIFTHHSGLFFIAEGDTSLLEKALNVLSMEGLGTDRSVGMGFFDFSTDTIDLELPEISNYQVSLSLFIPESEEQLHNLLDAPDTAYDFSRRGGWITTYPYTTLRKNAIYGFLPGSVFKKNIQDNCPLGKIVNLKPEIGEQTPDHPIWRNGKAIMLPIIIKE